MVYARRNALPSHAKLNKAGALSLLSFVRALDLPDDVVFQVQVDEDTKSLVLTPTGLAAVPTD